MLTDPLLEALDEVTQAQPYVPDVGDAVRRGQRLQSKRRRIAIAGATLAAVGILTGVLVALPGSSDQNASVIPAPVASATPAPPASSPTAPPPAPTRTPADPALVRQVTTLPTAEFASIPASTDGSGLTEVNGSPLVVDGKPIVFWDGAEYSPFCAVERWPLVVALSRFGTWSSLSTLTSASGDTPSDIDTFSFYGARYESPYVSFQSVETYTNQLAGSGFYQPLQTLTTAQAALVQRYDRTNGSIPFLDIANAFVMTGASYDYSVLEGKNSGQIAAALLDPTSDVSKRVIGSANAITAAICTVTGNQPSSVCSVPPITATRH